MMSRKSQTNTEQRREFLKQLAVAGGATAAVALTAGAAAAEPEPAPGIAKEEPRGYQETPHIRTYYRTARL